MVQGGKRDGAGRKKLNLYEVTYQVVDEIGVYTLIVKSNGTIDQVTEKAQKFFDAYTSKLNRKAMYSTLIDLEAIITL